LHGGIKGFNTMLWQVEPFHFENAAGAVMEYKSPAGEEGFPGEVRVRVTYSLNDRSELSVEYRAETDQATHVNLSQHAYFNLSGGHSDITSHELQLNASRYLPVRVGMIPTGEMRCVADGPFDFRSVQPIGARIDEADEQLQLARGYDHTFVIDRNAWLTFAGRLRDPVSGRTLTVHTTQPGIHVYSGNWLNASGRQGTLYGVRSGVALETQHFPDSPNQTAFPSTVLRPGEQYRAQSVYGFTIT
jgi:aldose 1-epimerase